MARFKITAKDGTIRHEGRLRYSGSYLKPSYLEFSEVASPEPIAWEVGDYVDYPRTGMRYRLYSIPQATKNARKGTHGRAFTYSNVQLHSAAKELEIALFRDLVQNDNNIHFSTSPDVATFENVEGIARRIQACMDDLYPGRWEIRLADFDAVRDAEVVARISEAKDFVLSNGTCLDALSKIYELWDDLGWIHTYDEASGKEVITIGYANRRVDENTTSEFLYGKGNGLTAIKRNQTNKEEFATRLYIYGSERNLPSRYYNGKSILNAESVDIRNLMLPLDKWGKTDGLPDARKAYLENADAVAKYGVIPRVHYFDSEDAGADIYPSIEGMTIGHVRKALADLGETLNVPSYGTYPNPDERVDAVLSAVNPTDNGELKKKGDAYEASAEIALEQYESSVTIPAGNTDVVGFYPTRTLVDARIEKSGMGKISINPKIDFVVEGEGIESVKAVFTLADAYSVQFRSVTSTKEVSGVKEEGSNVWRITIPKMSIKYDGWDRQVFNVYLLMDVSVTPVSGNERTAVLTPPTEPVVINFERVLPSTFSIDLKQIGFDINERADIGSGKTISMKTGMCAGRNFEISDCTYVPSSDSWRIDCKRQQDDTLGVLFPNSEYRIEPEDKFVLLDIAMPETYIHASMERLLAEGNKLLARASKVQSNYEPSIDAKVMMESGRIIREGMFMEITDEDVVDGTTDYIIIDSLTIHEDESAIPTYKVTLRERKKVTYKGTPSATSTTNTRSVDDTTEVEVNLSGYATEQYVNSLFARLKEIQSWFYKTEEGAIGTAFDFFSEREVSSGMPGGEGTDVPNVIVDFEMSDVSENPIANRVVKSYIDDSLNLLIADLILNPSDYIKLKTINGLSLYGEGNIQIEGGGEGTAGLNAINVNGTSYQPDENGIITLPNYPSPTTVDFLREITSGKKIGTLTINGTAIVLYAPDKYAWSDITGTDVLLNTFTKVDGSNATGTWNISTKGNAATATKLANKRKIWGNDFDGSSDITGDLKLNASIVNNNSKQALTVGTTTLSLGNGYLESGRYVYINGYNIFFSATGNNDMALNSQGYFGINTSYPSYRLDVNGTTRISERILIGSGAVDDDTKALYVSGSSVLKGLVYISGRVGLGYSTPQYKLDVAGNGHFTNEVILDSTLSVKGKVDFGVGREGISIHDTVPKISFHNSSGVAISDLVTFSDSKVLIHQKAEFEDSVKIGDATISWDASANALKVDKNIYSTEDVSAGGN